MKSKWKVGDGFAFERSIMYKKDKLMYFYIRKNIIFSYSPYIFIHSV